MFMFWGKRTSYTKRLLKAQVRGEHETECEAQENHSIVVRSRNSPELSSPSSSPVKKSATAPKSESSNNRNNSRSFSNPCKNFNTNNTSSLRYENDSNINNRTARCKELLKSLKENQLEMLLAAVESYGANLGSCVMVKRRPRASESEIDPDIDIKSRVFNGGEGRNESLEMTTTGFKNVDRNSRPYHHHHHHHHHNTRNNRHGCNRRQRSFVGAKGSGDLENNDGDGDGDSRICKDGGEKRRRDCDDEEETSVGRRIVTGTTTTANSIGGRRCRAASGGTSNEDNLPVDPHLLCCQIWRWPDLNNCEELKRLPVCHSDTDNVDVCCNPYHWSRLCKPESPPPPYCLIADRLRPEDRAPSEGDVLHRYRNTNSPPLPGSLTTNGEDMSGQREWCTLAYWELGGRVGRLYPVEPSTVNVFDSLLDGDGLCLATLAENHHSTSPAIQRTRSKIGLGLMLSQESDGVWAYNRSDNPIFVNSPTLDDPESRTLLVYRVPPGYCLNIFDRSKTVQLPSSSSSSSSSTSSTSSSSSSSSSSPTYSPIISPSSGGFQPPSTTTTTTTALSGGGLASGPVDVNSVRISFAKGWGPKYSRQEVTSCPCWLEVLLAPCR